MKKLIKKEKFFNTIEAYACACASCNCSSGCYCGCGLGVDRVWLAEDRTQSAYTGDRAGDATANNSSK